MSACNASIHPCPVSIFFIFLYTHLHHLYSYHHPCPPAMCQCLHTRITGKFFFSFFHSIFLQPVTTVTVPTPIRPIPTCLHPSWVIRITPEHPMANPNSLAPSQANSRLMHPQTLWPPHISAMPPKHPNIYTHPLPDAPSTFPLSRVKPIPNTHTHS